MHYSNEVVWRSDKSVEGKRHSQSLSIHHGSCSELSKFTLEKVLYHILVLFEVESGIFIVGHFHYDTTCISSIFKMYCNMYHSLKTYTTVPQMPTGVDSSQKKEYECVHRDCSSSCQYSLYNACEYDRL